MGLSPLVEQACAGGFFSLLVGSRSFKSSHSSLKACVALDLVRISM